MNRRNLTVLVAGGIVMLLAVWALTPTRTDVPEPLAEPNRPTVGEPGAPPRSTASGGPPGQARGADGAGRADGAAVAWGDPSSLTDEELAALAEELAADPRTHVVCGPRHRGASRRGLPRDRRAQRLNGRRVTIVNGKAYLPLVYDLGDLGDTQFAERTGTFSLDGYGPVAIGWTDRPDGGTGSGTAPIDPAPGRASLTGTLTLRPSGAPAAGRLGRGVREHGLRGSARRRAHGHRARALHGSSRCARTGCSAR